MFFGLTSSHAPTRPIRSLVRAGVIATALAAVLARPAPSIAQETPPAHPAETPTVEVYDARDLAALYARPGAAQTVTTEKPDAVNMPAWWMRQPAGRGEAGVDRLNGLFESMASAVTMTYVQFTPGVFAVTADKQTHTSVRAMLTQLRELSKQRYELDLVVYPVATSAVPALGSTVTFDPASVTTRMRTTVLRRLAQPIEAVTRIAYISDWMPIVADNAVGNDPTTSEVVSGLSCVALVGAGPDSNEVVYFQLSGRISRATVDPAPVGGGRAFTSSGPASEGLGIGLPKVDERSISADLPVGVATGAATGGRPTAVAVVPGFEAGQSLVIAVSIREIK